MKKDAPEITIPSYLDEPYFVETEASPFEILNKAAAKMEEQTGGLVKAKVYVAPFLGTIRYTFYLVIPNLNDYTDPLFYVWTSQPNRSYPVYLLESGAEQKDQKSCDKAKVLVASLEQIFQSSWVKSRIRQWIEMAEERRTTG